MNDFFKKYKDALGGKTTEADFEDNEGKQDPLTNQELIDKVFEVYKTRFKEESTRFSMIYPTCFRIYLHHVDFKARQDAFNIISRDLQIEFCAFNRAEMSKYKHNLPISTDWLFQFIEFQDGLIVEEVTNMKMGEVNIIATLYSNDFSKNKDNISNEGNVLMTKQAKNTTNPQKLNNVNTKAFLGMDMLDGNRYRIKILENYEETTSIPISDDKVQNFEKINIATLICDKKFVSGKKTGNKYSIMDNYVEISGINDTRIGSQYIKIDSNLLTNSFVHIKYENNRFWLAAFGKVRLNGMEVKISKGGDLHWETLIDNSRLMINDQISIEFKKNK